MSGDELSERYCSSIADNTAGSNQRLLQLQPRMLQRNRMANLAANRERDSASPPDDHLLRTSLRTQAEDEERMRRYDYDRTPKTARPTHSQERHRRNKKPCLPQVHCTSVFPLLLHPLFLRSRGSDRNHENAQYFLVPILTLLAFQIRIFLLLLITSVLVRQRLYACTYHKICDLGGFGFQ